MMANEVILVCEGEREGPDIRWLGLALDALQQFGRIDVEPSGSKANLKPTIEGLKRWTKPPKKIVAVRDRDFLTRDLVHKDLVSSICPLTRHCLESYLIDPALLEAVFRVTGMEMRLLAIAEARIWTDIARAVLDAFAFEVRRHRPSVDQDTLITKDQAISVVTAKADAFRTSIVLPDVAAEVSRIESDMRNDPLWTRVDGKAVLEVVEKELKAQGHLVDLDLERRLFSWCAENGPPAAFVADLRMALSTLGV